MRLGEQIILLGILAEVWNLKKKKMVPLLIIMGKLCPMETMWEKMELIMEIFWITCHE